MAEPLTRLGPSPCPDAATPALRTEALSVFAHGKPARTILREVELSVARGEVLALVGPSGAGKSTLLKCLNRLVDLELGLSVRGQVYLDGAPIYARGVEPDRLRTRVGMLFQRPVVFPGSVLENVLFGVRHAELPRPVARRERRALAERVLREAALWKEVADRLDAPATTLSVGQQQRLCLARTLALDPEVVRMDEPTAALDPRSAREIEALILELRQSRAVVLVTHDPEQARRVADRAACVSPTADGPDGGGAVVSCASCDTLFETMVPESL
jgi:phosphate transport system ATP-binding protein